MRQFLRRRRFSALSPFALSRQRGQASLTLMMTFDSFENKWICCFSLFLKSRNEENNYSPSCGGSCTEEVGVTTADDLTTRILLAFIPSSSAALLYKCLIFTTRKERFKIAAGDSSSFNSGGKGRRKKKKCPHLSVSKLRSGIGASRNRPSCPRPTLWIFRR